MIQYKLTCRKRFDEYGDMENKEVSDDEFQTLIAEIKLHIDPIIAQYDSL